MKTIIKSLMFVALFGGIATSANAQLLGKTGSTTTHARILKQITLFTDSVQFGAVAAGGGPSFLSPSSTQGQSTNIGFNSTVGRLRIDATPQEPVRVVFDSLVTMYRDSSGVNTDSIYYHPMLAGKGGDLSISTANLDAAELTSKDQPTAAGQFTAPTNQTGRGPFAIIQTQASDRATIYLGGNLYESTGGAAITSAKRTGTYRGTINFNVFYLN